MSTKAAPASVKLSAESVTALDAMTKRFGVDRSEMIERLIFGTARTPTPAQE